MSVEKLRVVSLVALASLAACGPSTEPSTSTTHRAITSSKWISCWVRPAEDPSDFFQKDTITCSAAIGSEGPLSVSHVSVRVTAPADPEIEYSAVLDEIILRTNEPTNVSRLWRTQYPAKLRVSVQVSAREVLGLRSPTLVQEVDIPAFDRYPMERPISFEQPFDLWPVELVVATRYFYAAFDPYQLGVSPFTAFFESTPNGSQIEIKARTPATLRSGETKTLYVAVPRGERPRLTGQAMLDRPPPGSNEPPKTRIEIDGPGTYDVVATGLVRRAAPSGEGTTQQHVASCPDSWFDDGWCDLCLGDDPDCSVNGVPGCQAQWSDDGLCDPCLGADPDCGSDDPCPESWRSDGVCDACLGDDPDCAGADCPDHYRDDGICDECLGDDPDCDTVGCPESWRDDGVCDDCLGDDPDCDATETCPDTWYGDGVCDPCLGDDPDCDAPACDPSWYGDGICDTCLGDDPDCAPDSCPPAWYDDGTCDECLGDDPDCAPTCNPDWYDDGICDECLGDDPDCW